MERVVSTITHREYALKRIRRGTTFRKDKQVLRDFEKELSNLKTLSRGHVHIIELMGSFTEPKYVGILFPVADCTLADILDRQDAQSQKWSLRAYFGCLASALGFLHDNNIRHKDIKPQNILVKDDTPFFTDFGVSIDWTEYGQSTTIGPTAMTPRYCAPEVAACEPRNTSSDIWSLGCVFLEMYAALKGATSKDLVEIFTTNGQLQPYHSSSPSIFDQLQGLATSHSEHLPISWIKHMVAPRRDDRWSAHLIVERIRDCSADPAAKFLYIGLCCLDSDDTAESVISYTEPSMEDSSQKVFDEPGRDQNTQEVNKAAISKLTPTRPADERAIDDADPTTSVTSTDTDLDDRFRSLRLHERTSERPQRVMRVYAEFFEGGKGQTKIPKVLVSQEILTGMKESYVIEDKVRIACD